MSTDFFLEASHFHVIRTLCSFVLVAYNLWLDCFAVLKVDLDLGNYERFLDIKLTRDNNITTGKIYQVDYISSCNSKVYLIDDFEAETSCITNVLYRQ